MQQGKSGTGEMDVNESRICGTREICDWLYDTDD
jgi:hypothetical protein